MGTKPHTKNAIEKRSGLKQIKTYCDVLVIGSGASGLAAAVRLHALGVRRILLCTEGLHMGTSINTGSDKQTYYKLGLYGSEADSPLLLASDLMKGGGVHGDLALAEASLSVIAFSHLATLGVPFPHDEYGAYPGYKTDNDPRRRATSCGPYTSREMCLALIRELRRRRIPVAEQLIATDLLSDGRTCYGAVFADLSGKGLSSQSSQSSQSFPQSSASFRHAGNSMKTMDSTDSTDSPDFPLPVFRTVFARYTVFAVGGPGGLYGRSVYPEVHTGAIGLAFEAGAKGRNLPESQFGLAAVKFRWNVSGSYLQALPRFVSCARDGVSDEREFLREYFRTPEEMYNAIFLKGYQWPFSAEHLPGSSVIDLLVYRESVLRGRRVCLDYRSDPPDFRPERCSAELREYLRKSRAEGDSPLKRLKALNEPAWKLFAEHGIDLGKEALEVAVCAQHNNGGLAGDRNWESETLRNFYPVGEVNGSHGLARPGGAALNAGQCGAFRAAEAIALSLNTQNMRNRSRAGKKADSDSSSQAGSDWVAETEAEKRAEVLLKEYERRLEIPCLSAEADWRRQRGILRERMDRAGCFVREEKILRSAIQETRGQLSAHQNSPLGFLHAEDLAEVLRNRQLLTAQLVYLEAILAQMESASGSRGGSVVLSPAGIPLPGLPEWKILPEDPAFRNCVLETLPDRDGKVHSEWKPCRSLPEQNEWFETLWKKYREIHSANGTGKREGRPENEKGSEATADSESSESSGNAGNMIHTEGGIDS